MEAVFDDERIYNTVIRSIVVLGLIAYTLISTSGGLDALRGLYASAMILTAAVTGV
jgi:ABC-type tungstate transport system substrate-binding protein